MTIFSELLLLEALITSQHPTKASKEKMTLLVGIGSLRTIIDRIPVTMGIRS